MRFNGTVEVVGEEPRTGGPVDALADVEARFAAKYSGPDGMAHDGGHVWLRAAPEKTTSGDFREIPTA
ncbi:hypothetical protein [Actinorugispora endophytica]|uniref:Uncharacterized protein n=1 Tax=Actinorugispora endophytica TaxID=1605990 RepID=A0A4R6V3J2_9ACTN|nr:hypothetical protein [Actinorugispora endophytica]TDQ53278.1 hypothetical protein EV190_10467 [Actinorugispora endophytica]